MNPLGEPLALPGPLWLFDALLLLLFLFHVVPMSVTLGGGFYAALAAALGRSQPGYQTVAARLAGSLPLFTAGTVTTGVATLLFLQVQYGELFYGAAVVIAWPWLGVVGLVLLGYYGYYLHSLTGRGAPRLAGVSAAVAWLLFVVVAFIYTNQMTLMLEPGRMHALHAADATGWNLNLGEPTLWSRYLHMLVGAIALAGLWVAWLGASALERGEETAGRLGLRLGARGFVWASVIEGLVGLWMLHALPRRLGLLFLGGDLWATTLVGASLVLTVGAVVIVGRSPRATRPRRRLVVGAAHAVVIVGLMVLMRDLVRHATLAAVFRPATMIEQPVNAVIVLFFLLLLAGGLTVAWMVAQVLRAGGRVSR